MKTRTYLVDGIIVDVYHLPRRCKIHLLPPPAGHYGWRETILFLRPKKLGAPVPRPTKAEIEEIARKHKNRQRICRDRLL